MCCDSRSYRKSLISRQCDDCPDGSLSRPGGYYWESHRRPCSNLGPSSGENLGPSSGENLGHSSGENLGPSSGENLDPSSGETLALHLVKTLALHLVKILAFHLVKILALHLGKTMTVTPPLMEKSIVCSCMELLARISDLERGAFSPQAGKCVGLKVTRSKVKFVTPSFSYDSILVLAPTWA